MPGPTLGSHHPSALLWVHRRHLALKQPFPLLLPAPSPPSPCAGWGRGRAGERQPGGHTWPRVREQEGQGRRQLAVSKTVTLQRVLAHGQSRGRQDEGGEPGGGYTGPGLASLLPRGDPSSPLGSTGAGGSCGLPSRVRLSCAPGDTGIFHQPTTETLLGILCLLLQERGLGSERWWMESELEPLQSGDRGTSLVVQWLRIHLPMAWTWV